MKHSCLAVLLAAGLLAGCSSAKSSAGGTPSPTATNPITFPLFDGSNVLSAHEWHNTISAHPGAVDSAFLAQGAGKYDGHDVVAGTQAMMPVLESWLDDLAVHPPAGYHVAITGNGIDAVRTHTRALGVDFTIFQGTDQGKTRGIAVMVVDPQTLDEKAGPMLGLVSRFKHVPSMLRDPLDAQAKKQTGFSITEAIDPETPIGAAIAALGELHDFGGRGIVLIDAVKE